MNCPAIHVFVQEPHAMAARKLLQYVIANVRQWGQQVGRIPRTNSGRAFIQWAHDDAVARYQADTGNTRYTFAIHYLDDGSVKALLLFDGQTLPADDETLRDMRIEI